jgi:hypothetical protein
MLVKLNYRQQIEGESMKNKTKAKTLSSILVVLTLALLPLFLLGCKDESGAKQPVERTFTIQIWEQNITVKDTRTGKDDVDLEELGVIQKLEDAIIELGEFDELQTTHTAFVNAITAHPITIKIEAPDEQNRYDYAKVPDYKTATFDIAFLTKPNNVDDVESELAFIISRIPIMPTPDP